MTDHNTSSLNDCLWIVVAQVIWVMMSLSCGIFSYTTHKFQLEMHRILKLHAWVMYFFSSSSHQPTIIQNLPHLSANLLSVSRIIEQCYGVYFELSNLEVIDMNNLQIVASGKKEVGLYHLNNSNKSLLSCNFNLLHLLHQSYALVAQEDAQLWHAHLGTSIMALQNISSSKRVDAFRISKCMCYRTHSYFCI